MAWGTWCYMIGHVNTTHSLHTYTVVNQMDIGDHHPLHATCTQLFPPHYLGTLNGVTLLEANVVQDVSNIRATPM